MPAALSAASTAKPAPARGGPEWCAEILRKVTDLFLCDTQPLNQRQLELYDDIFARLMSQAGPQALADLSGALSSAKVAPPATTKLLASHGDALVAAPMLAKASWLPERDLIDLIKTASAPHLLAIAARKGLGETLTDALMVRGYPALRAALAQNQSARFSEDGYRSLFKSAERDADLAEKLARRADLPARLSRDFVTTATDAARARFIKTAPPATQTPLRNQPRSRSLAPAPEDYAEAKKELVALNRVGKLGDGSVNRFAVANDYVAVVAALALLTDVTVETIEPLMDDDSLANLIVACRASRLSWATTVMIIRNRPGCAPPSEDDLREAQKRFEKLSLSEAQLTIRNRARPN